MAIRVFKTLVIGLGTKGTEICDAVYRRLRWQYGGMESIPWVRFLCIETDESKNTLLRKDFMAMTVDQHSFIDYKESPSRHDERMQLTKWLDRQALEDLKSDFVSGGAGNIRMIGRLAFFHNYVEIKRAVRARLDQLRDTRLDEVLRHMRSLGFDEELEFAADGALRVFVVGSLTGGTCSGCAPDMGFLVRSMLQQDRGDAWYALLGMPTPDLSEADEGDAERFKKNAWHALVELNTYYRPGDNLPPIRYPGESNEVTGDAAPYFAVFLFRPDGTSKRDIEKLHGQIAESIYLNILSADVDPKAQKVDMTQNHFCAQGLAVIEFPAQRVMEACTKRLLQEALDHWLTTAGANRAHAEVGVNWDWLVESCARTPGGEKLADLVASDIREVSRLLDKMDIDKAEEKIDAISAKFRGSGTFRKYVDEHVRGLPERLKERLHEKVPSILSSIDHGGPHNVAEALRTISKFLAQLESSSRADMGATDVEGDLRKLRRVRRSWLLLIMGLRGEAAKPIRYRIESALRSACLEEAIDRLVLESVRAGRVVPQCEAILSEFIRRLIALKDRARQHEGLLRTQWENLAKNEPVVRGYSLFKHAVNSTDDGTVQEEYQESLKKADPSPAKNFDAGRKRAMTEVFERMNDIQSGFPKRGESWLDQTQRAESDPPLPDRVTDPMFKHAATFFEEVKNEDVLERWRIEQDAKAKAERIFDLSTPSVQVDPSRATKGGATPPRERKLLLLPSVSNDQYRQEFKEAVSHKTRGFDNLASPDAHTVACIQQHLGLSLDAILPVIGARGLHTAQCGDFRVWHTRRTWNGSDQRSKCHPMWSSCGRRSPVASSLNSCGCKTRRSRWTSTTRLPAAGRSAFPGIHKKRPPGLSPDGQTLRANPLRASSRFWTSASKTASFVRNRMRASSTPCARVFKTKWLTK